MINVSRIITSRNFAQGNGFKVYRKSGQWNAGRFIQNETELNLPGTITAANPKDLEQIPEGDRVTGIMCFYSPEKIYVTHVQDGSNNPGTSDEIEWHGERYKVISVVPWVDFGYCKAFGVRMVST